MRARTMLIAAAFLGGAVGCASTDTEFHVPGTVMLKVGGSAAIVGTGWTVSFDSVTSDSRCPLGVYCIQAGEGQLVLRMTDPLFDPMVGDTPQFTLGSQPVVKYGYRFTQLELAPVARQNVRIDRNSYVVTLKVEAVGQQS